MNALKTLQTNLSEIISQEGITESSVLASYVVGELLGDYDGIYTKLKETNPAVQRIGELASDLEISNGSEEQLAAIWKELKDLVQSLEN